MSVHDDTTGHDSPFSAVGGGGAVDSVNGQTGDVVLAAANVGALPTGGPGSTSERAALNSGSPFTMFESDSPYDILFAWGMPDDDFPRFVVFNNGYMAFGAGDVDPTITEFGLTVSPNGSPQVWSIGGDVRVAPGFGFVVPAPDGTPYRIKVANDGTLSTEAT